MTAENKFKYDPKKMRHATQRIIAISEVLEEQSKSVHILKQSSLEHHTLDYYGCMEYLREQGYINYYGKKTGKYGGTITGNPKQSEVKDFLKKMGLEYAQFTNKD